MITSALAEKFTNDHQEFMRFIDQLSKEDFEKVQNNKWSPGQQLQHVNLCINPINRALHSKSFIAEKFGTIDRPLMNEEQIINDYKIALASGGKAPEQFVPGIVSFPEKTSLMNALNENINAIAKVLSEYSDEEMDRLVLPHPLLGKMTLREMLFLMSEHALHHLEQTKANLLN